MKRTLAIILSLVLLFSVLPLTAYAAEADAVETGADEAIAETGSDELTITKQPENAFIIKWSYYGVDEYKPYLRFGVAGGSGSYTFEWYYDLDDEYAIGEKIATTTKPELQADKVGWYRCWVKDTNGKSEITKSVLVRETQEVPAVDFRINGTMLEWKESPLEDFLETNSLGVRYTLDVSREDVTHHDIDTDFFNVKIGRYRSQEVSVKEYYGSVVYSNSIADQYPVTYDSYKKTYSMDLKNIIKQDQHYRDIHFFFNFCTSVYETGYSHQSGDSKSESFGSGYFVAEDLYNGEIRCPDTSACIHEGEAQILEKDHYVGDRLTANLNGGRFAGSSVDITWQRYENNAWKDVNTGASYYVVTNDDLGKKIRFFAKPRTNGFINGEVYFDDEYFISNEITVNEKYNLWVGSVQVTSDNRNDILGDSGKAKYDPSSQTLTLNNPTINGDHDGAKIYCTGMDLLIAGSYKMTSAANNSLGVFVSGGKVIFDGNFAFYSVGSNAVYSNKDVVVREGSLFAKSSNNTGLYAGGKLETGWSNTKVEAQGVSKAIHAGGGFNTDLTITTPTNGKFGTNTIYESNGTTVAKHVVLEEDQRWTVTFDPNGGTGNMAPVKVNKGTSYKLPECGFTHPNGNQFKNWVIGSYVYNPGDTVTINSNTTVYAQWKGKYTITYDRNGGTGTMAAETYNEGDKYVIPSCRFTPPTNMIFGGWLVDGKPDSVGNYWNVYSDHTLKPQWIPSSGIAERVDITVTAPKADEMPSYDVTVYGSGNVITGNEVPVSGSPGVYTQYKGVLWRDMTTRKNHRSNAAFVDGHEYRISVDLKSLGGTKFNFEDDSKPMTQIYINGSAAEIQPAAIDNTICTAMYTFTKDSTVSGSETSYLSDTDTVTIQLLQSDTVKYSTTTTGNTGSYSIPNVASGSYTLRVSKPNHVDRDYSITVSGNTTQDVKICPKGDVDGNGKVQANDAMKAYQHAQGKANAQLSGYAFDCADMAPVGSPNGKVQAADAMVIYQQAQGKHSLF